MGNHAAYFVKELQAEEVICFEPVPLAKKIPTLNTRLNDISKRVNLSYLGMALGDQVGTVILKIPPRNLGGARAIDG